MTQTKLVLILCKNHIIDVFVFRIRVLLFEVMEMGGEGCKLLRRFVVESDGTFVDDGHDGRDVLLSLRSFVFGPPPVLIPHVLFISALRLFISALRSEVLERRPVFHVHLAPRADAVPGLWIPPALVTTRTLREPH